MLRSCGTCVMLTILRPRLLQRLVLCWCRTFFALPILQPSSGFRACLRSLRARYREQAITHGHTHARAHIIVANRNSFLSTSLPEEYEPLSLLIALLLDPAAQKNQPCPLGKFGDRRSVDIGDRYRLVEEVDDMLRSLPKV